MGEIGAGESLHYVQSSMSFSIPAGLRQKTFVRPRVFVLFVYSLSERDTACCLKHGARRKSKFYRYKASVSPSQGHVPFSRSLQTLRSKAACAFVRLLRSTSVLHFRIALSCSTSTYFNLALLYWAHRNHI